MVCEACIFVVQDAGDAVDCIVLKLDRADSDSGTDVGDESFAGVADVI